MSTPASILTAELLSAIPREFPNIRLWRQNTGAGVPMNTVNAAIALILGGKLSAGVAMLRRPTKFGVVGGGDLSGIICKRVPELGTDGKGFFRYGLRLEVEIKAGKDRQSPEQIAFQNLILSSGGVYIVARDVEGCLKELRDV